jgi:site-specific DNA-cytosine methylase
MWRQLLIEVFQKSVPVQKYWDLPNGAKTEKEITLEGLLMGSPTEDQYILTEESLSKSLEDLYNLMKLYTTLTLTKETIQPKISMFFQIGEVIGRLILRLSGSSPNSLSATSSFLTLSQNLTNYARQTSRDIFSEMGGIYEITNIIKQANNRDATFGYLGDWRVAAAVLFERESLQGNIKPSRKKREEVTANAEGSVGEAGSWWDGSQVAGTLTKQNANGAQRMPDKDNFGAILQPAIIDRAAFNQGENAQYEPRIEAGETMSSLVARGPHAVAQPIAVQDVRPIEKAQNGRGWNDDGTSYTIDTKATQGVAQPIAFKVRGGCEGGGKGYLGQEEQAFTISTMQDQQIAQPIAVDTYNQTINEHTSQTIGSSASDVNHYGGVLHSMAIRRLTPKECERLQGFPDDWTKIPYRNKEADQCPDGPRYKACGNSMAVPVMRWIGQRIQLIEKMINK